VAKGGEAAVDERDVRLVRDRSFAARKAPAEEFPVTGFVQELGRVGLYKRTQGRITRQVTAAALLVTIALGCWQLSLVFKTWSWLQARGRGLEFAIPGLLLALGAWLCYRLVNYPPFADFLIAVEAEMAKVSWPSRRELVRATIVVLVSMFVLTVMLSVYDTAWWLLLYKLLNISGKA
jgi:preprotein translocase subunit SecE